MRLLKCMMASLVIIKVCKIILVEKVDIEEIMLNERDMLFNSSCDVTKGHFLSLIMQKADLFMKIEKDMIMSEFQRYSRDNQGAISFNDFELFMNNLDPSISRASTIKVFTKVACTTM
eukprot:TRINITY_DN14741_c0_g1_i2.p4 TRINITY_DN14741_c0_g1~~TRINITY_DN14741_c0_g1_i2.p4  ORF type:complete len:118 (-),score=18.61 TRINITY_DN14741_c0_g1_i2:299-652(-)